MLDQMAHRTLFDLSAEDLAERLFGAMSPRAFHVGEGGIRAFLANWLGQCVIICVFDSKLEQGAIGRSEADQLVRAIRVVEPGAAIVFVMNTSGIRVTDSTHGIASLRRVLREAEDARIRGVRMLALVIKQAFGGASILAGLCERRIIHDGCLFAMSGPRLIEQSVGSAQFDSRDRSMVEGVLGGVARAQFSDEFVCLAPTIEAYRAATFSWLEGQPEPPVAFDNLAERAQQLGSRLGEEMCAEALTESETPRQSAALTIVRKLAGAGAELSRKGNVFVSKLDANPKRVVLALVTPDGCGFRDAVMLAAELLSESRHLRPGGEMIIVVDAESHASTVLDERPILSEALAHLALSIRWIASLGGLYVRLVVGGFGGGGIQGALGSAASSVTMHHGARLRVLPKAAMQALNRSEDGEAGSLAMGVSVGAVDAEFSDGQ